MSDGCPKAHLSQMQRVHAHTGCQHDAGLGVSDLAKVNTPHLSMIPSRVEPCCALAAACSCIILTRPARILATSCACLFCCKQWWSVPGCLLSCLA